MVRMGRRAEQKTMYIDAEFEVKTKCPDAFVRLRLRARRKPYSARKSTMARPKPPYPWAFGLKSGCRLELRFIGPYRSCIFQSVFYGHFRSPVYLQNLGGNGIHACQNDRHQLALQLEVPCSRSTSAFRRNLSGMNPPG